MTRDIGPGNMTLKRTLGIHWDITHIVLPMPLTQIEQHQIVSWCPMKGDTVSVSVSVSVTA